MPKIEIEKLSEEDAEPLQFGPYIARVNGEHVGEYGRPSWNTEEEARTCAERHIERYGIKD